MKVKFKRQTILPSQALIDRQIRQESFQIMSEIIT